MRVSFIKMHGLGNDFVVLDGRAQPVPAMDGRLAAALADRRTGIGCDQLIVLEPSTAADFRMRIFNADGGEVESCGNAARAVGLLHGKPARIETLGGIIASTPVENGISVNMGTPRFGWDEIPLAYAMDTLAMPVGWDGLEGPVAVNVGNPHAVFFVPDCAAVDLAEIGPRIEHDPLFPDRVNVNVATIVSRDAIRLRVWERGVGETRACGTGACATAIAAMRRGLLDRRVTVHLAGGPLVIGWGEDQHITMTGAAAESFRGNFDSRDFGGTVVTVEVLSLGCRLNLSESEELRALLAGNGDLVVVNSCAVTAEAVRQTRQAIRRARRARPDARLLVTGCAAEVEREALARMPEVDGLVANAAKLDPRSWNVACSAPALPSRHTRAFIQVQNGCDHACTFCVIPQGRGASRSRRVAEVLADVARHLDAGAREVVLTGVDLTSWGADLPQSPRLGGLVSAILDAFPILSRLRLSSLDGMEIDDGLIDLLCGEARVMPHVHLSLQHGNDLILKRMKRRHSRADALALAGRMRAARADIAFGADLIAGFPTEDAAAHADNLSIIGELGVVHGHVFPFSPRPGTPAARMPQVDTVTVKARAAELRAAVAREHALWQAGHLGRPLSVLAERDGTGHAPDFARVRLSAGTTPGAIVAVTPQAVIEGMLV